MSRVGLLIAAAGRGERLGCTEPKALVKLGGKTLLQHVLDRLAPLVKEIVIAITPGELEQFRSFVNTAKIVGVKLIEGGSRRQDSVRMAMAAFSSSDVVMIHDAARPLCPAKVAQKCLDAVDAGVGACAALPVADTLVREEEPGFYGENIERAGVWQVQTPQVFVWQEIAEAHAWAYGQGGQFTDDASLYCARAAKCAWWRVPPSALKLPPKPIWSGWVGLLAALTQITNVLSIFDDKSHQPSPNEVSKVLGDSAAWWDEIVTFVSQTYPPITELWNHAGAKFGWSLRLKQKDRVVLYLTPHVGSFLAGVVLGEKAAQTARDEGSPAAVLAAIDGSPKYAEGRGIRLSITSVEDVTTVQELLRLKMGK